jgi:hypothetical protein
VIQDRPEASPLLFGEEAINDRPLATRACTKGYSIVVSVEGQEDVEPKYGDEGMSFFFWGQIIEHCPCVMVQAQLVESMCSFHLFTNLAIPFLSARHVHINARRLKR